MVFEVMFVILVCVPLFVVWRMWERSNDLAERHHAHHDTYSVSPALLQVVAYASICSSFMGIVLGCLCATGNIAFDSITVTVFFSAFSLTCAAIWVLLSRYCIATYDTQMCITPFFGKPFIVAYEKITAMKWTPAYFFATQQSIRVAFCSSQNYSDYVSASKPLQDPKKRTYEQDEVGNQTQDEMLAREQNKNAHHTQDTIANTKPAATHDVSQSVDANAYHEDTHYVFHIWSILDIEQILMRINRFDVLDSHK